MNVTVNQLDQVLTQLNEILAKQSARIDVLEAKVDKPAPRKAPAKKDA